MPKRRTFSQSFKAKVAIEALKEQKTVSAIAQEYKISPIQVTKWKTQALELINNDLTDQRRKKLQPEQNNEALYALIGKLQYQLEFLKKKMGSDD